LTGFQGPVSGTREDREGKARKHVSFHIQHVKESLEVYETRPTVLLSDALHMAAEETYLQACPDA